MASQQGLDRLRRTGYRAPGIVRWLEALGKLLSRADQRRWYAIVVLSVALWRVGVYAFMWLDDNLFQPPGCGYADQDGQVWDGATYRSWQEACMPSPDHRFGVVVWNERWIGWTLAAVITLVAVIPFTWVCRWLARRIVHVGWVRFRSEVRRLTAAAQSRIYVAQSITLVDAVRPKLQVTMWPADDLDAVPRMVSRVLGKCFWLPVVSREGTTVQFPGAHFSTYPSNGRLRLGTVMVLCSAANDYDLLVYETDEERAEALRDARLAVLRGLIGE